MSVLSQVFVAPSWKSYAAQFPRPHAPPVILLQPQTPVVSEAGERRFCPVHSHLL